MSNVMFVDDMKICLDVCRLDDSALFLSWKAMEEQGFDPHAWYDAQDRITMQQWYDALESELVRRRLI